jgi:hypothetical protein
MIKLKQSMFFFLLIGAINSNIAYADSAADAADAQSAQSNKIRIFKENFPANNAKTSPSKPYTATADNSEIVNKLKNILGIKEFPPPPAVLPKWMQDKIKQYGGKSVAKDTEPQTQREARQTPTVLGPFQNKGPTATGTARENFTLDGSGIPKELSFPGKNTKKPTHPRIK